MRNTKVKLLILTSLIILLSGTLVLASGKGEKEISSKALSAKHGGTLRVGQTTDITGPNPADMGQPQELFYQQVFDTMILQTREGTVEPMLAESWEWNADKTKIRFKLRQDVKFHSGKQFTADDVIANIKSHQNPAFGSKLRTSVMNIVRMEAVDKYTVDLYLKSFDVALFDALGMLYIIDPEVLTADNKLQGTGPFKFVEWVPGTRLVLERNPDYWDGDLPYLDKIVISVQPDAQTMVANLESGA
ncbi:MAG TPA: ABC transporter substrate-binding protein, partial [Spirochaetia bacterium]|nr:ABC transporter substrate-binding protein [Spirochaetia bacterium]